MNERDIAANIAVCLNTCLVLITISNTLIGVQHGGTNTLGNLAYCCPICNWKKGPNICTILLMGGELIPLFNPRKQNWFTHFESNNGRIIPLTEIGQATVRLLELNEFSKIEERLEMELGGFYP